MSSRRFERLMEKAGGLVPARVRLDRVPVRAAARSGIPLGCLGGRGAATRGSRRRTTRRASRAFRSSPGFAIVFVALGAAANLIARRAERPDEAGARRLHPRRRRARLHGPAAVDGPARRRRADPGRAGERSRVFCSAARSRSAPRRASVRSSPRHSPPPATRQPSSAAPPGCAAYSAGLGVGLPARRRVLRARDGVLPLDARSLPRVLARRRRDPRRARLAAVLRRVLSSADLHAPACSRRSASAISELETFPQQSEHAA